MVFVILHPWPWPGIILFEALALPVVSLTLTSYFFEAVALPTVSLTLLTSLLAHIHLTIIRSVLSNLAIT